MGVLSDILFQKTEYSTWLIDIDAESVAYLSKQYPALGERLIQGDFLKLDFKKLFEGPMAIIGNFPYNISSQILFKILEERAQVVEVVGMFQKEVAERCAAKPGSKEYGILSVFLQAISMSNICLRLKQVRLIHRRKYYRVCCALREIA